jgi:aspartyl-tRNA(Asn)/glutamyl-tRNA(Gln) amidotransferase subunit A
VGESLVYASASELIERYRRRELSPVEVTTAVLERIDRINPTLNAFVTVTHDLALRNARDAERAYARGEAGALAGVPVSIKDLTPTKGIRTARGSLLSADWVPEEDAPIVERLYAAGAVMLGKTNTPELGWKGDSGNRVFGPTFNPWNREKTAGGSSGGAAAAVASGLGPLAQGSDGAGSIRIPAAFCGIFGFKQSFGLVPQYPPSAVGDLSHLGPMTRTVADAARMLNAIAGEDSRDRLSWSSGIDYLDRLERGVTGLRIAWSPTLGYAEVAPDVAEPVERAAMVFSDLGAEIVRADPELPSPKWIIDVLWSTAMAGYFAGRLDEVGPLLDPGLLQVVRESASITGTDVGQAMQRRNAYYTGMRQFMEGFDLLLTPTMPITAFRAGDDAPEEVAREGVAPLDWTPFTYPFNLTGQPSATVPCGVDGQGMPVGLQIVGRWRDDPTVLRAAAAYEVARPWREHVPRVE